MQQLIVQTRLLRVEKVPHRHSGSLLETKLFRVETNCPFELEERLNHRTAEREDTMANPRTSRSGRCQAHCQKKSGTDSIKHVEDHQNSDNTDVRTHSQNCEHTFALRSFASSVPAILTHDERLQRPARCGPPARTSFTMRTTRKRVPKCGIELKTSFVSALTRNSQIFQCCATFHGVAPIPEDAKTVPHERDPLTTQSTSSGAVRR